MLEATITLADGRWYINGYVIADNAGEGYEVFPEDSEYDTKFESDSFEECVVWCMNS